MRQPPESPPEPASAAHAGAWERYFFASPKMRELWYVVAERLGIFTSSKEAPSHFSHDDPWEVLTAFRLDDIPAVQIMRGYSLEDLPKTGRYKIFIAIRQSGSLHLRIFDNEARMILDGPPPQGVTLHHLEGIIRPLRGRKRLKLPERNDIFLALEGVPGLHLRSRLPRLIESWRLSCPEAPFEIYFLCCLKNFASDYARKGRRDRALLDRLTVSLGAGFLSSTNTGSLDAIRAKRTLRNALYDLPAIARKGLALQYRRDSKYAGYLQPQTPAERQRTCVARRHFRTIHSVHITSETRFGCRMIASLSIRLFKDKAIRRLAIEHFAKGRDLRNLGIHPSEWESARRTFLAIARKLEPFLEDSFKLVLHLLPYSRQEKLAFLFSFPPLHDLELAQGLGCPIQDLEINVRRLFAEVDGLQRLLRLSKTPNGRKSLKTKLQSIYGTLDRAAAQKILLEDMDLSGAAKALSLSEKEFRDAFYRAVERMDDRYLPGSQTPIPEPRRSD